MRAQVNGLEKKSYLVFHPSHLLVKAFVTPLVLTRPVPSIKSDRLFQACNFIKMKLQHRCFSVNIGKSSRKSTLKSISKRLPLHLIRLTIFLRFSGSQLLHCLLHALSRTLIRKQQQPPNITKNITFKQKRTFFLIMVTFE